MSDETEIPKPQGVLQGIPASEIEERESAGTNSEEQVKRIIRDIVAESEPRYHSIHLQGAQDHYYHKGKWSWFLMGAVGAMMLLQFALLFPVGLGWLDYTAYDWLLPVLLVQTFGQVTGLAVYAVRYLFSDISNQASARTKGMADDSAKATETSEAGKRRGETLYAPPTSSRIRSFAWPVAYFVGYLRSLTIEKTTCELPPKATPKFADGLDLDRMALSVAIPARCDRTPILKV